MERFNPQEIAMRDYIRSKIDAARKDKLDTPAVDTRENIAESPVEFAPTVQIEIERLTKLNRELITELTRANLKCDKLADGYNQILQAFDSMQASNEKNSKLNQTLQSENARLRDEIDPVYAQLINAQEQIDELKDNIGSLTHNNNVLQNRADILQNRETELKSINDDVAATREELQKYKQLLEDAARSQLAIIAERDKLAKKVVQLEGYMATQYANYTGCLSSNNKTIAMQTEEIRKLKDEIKTLRDSESAEVQALKAKCKDTEIRSEKNHMTMRDALVKEGKDKTVLMDRIRELYLETEQLKKTISSNAAAATSTQSENNELRLERDVNELTKANDKLSQELAKIDRENVFLRAQFENLSETLCHFIK